MGPISHYPIRVVGRLDLPAQGFLHSSMWRCRGSSKARAVGFPVAHHLTLRAWPRWLLGIGTLTGPASLSAASEASPRRGAIGSPFLWAPGARGPQGCHQGSGLELDLLLESSLPLKFSLFLSGVKDFKSHFHQVGNGSLRTLLRLLSFFMDIGGGPRDKMGS